MKTSQFERDESRRLVAGAAASACRWRTRPSRAAGRNEIGFWIEIMG
jgi:hypothetical protein